MLDNGFRRTSLVGISYGGFVGYSMSVQFPEAVERLVVCCASVYLEEKDLKDELFTVSDVEEVEKILLAQTPEKLKELMKISFVKPLKGIPDYFLSDFINPTLILWGEKDQIFPLILGKRLERHLGENARLLVIANACHAVNFEKTKEFVKHHKDFLYNDSNFSFSDSSSFYSNRDDMLH